MTFGQFLDWLATQDLEKIDHDQLLDNVALVLETLRENDPRYAWMAVIEDKLLDGAFPRDRLAALAERFPVQLSIESRLRQRAGEAPGGQWETQALQGLRGCVREQDPATLKEYLAWMRQELHTFWLEYEPREAEASHIELEKVAGQLLREAYQNWQQALAQVDQGDFDRGLELAAQANRLLVALHDLDDSAVF